MNLIRCFLLLIIFLYSRNSFSQSQNEIDSLIKIVNSSAADTTKVNVLNIISRQYYLLEENDNAKKYAEEAVALAEKINFKDGLANALNNLGVLYNDLGNYSDAMKNFNAALNLNKETGDKKEQANSYNYIANSYHVQGDFPNALKNQFSALKIREEIGDKQGIAWSYNNIGIIYKLQGMYPEALKNYSASIKILEELGSKKEIATAYNNFGNIYSAQGNYSDALKNYITSLNIRMEIGEQRDISTSYNNIGDVFCDLFEKDSVTKEVNISYSDGIKKTILRSQWLDTALALQSKALAINNKLSDKYFSIFSLSGIGRINFLRKNYQETIKYYSKAYKLADAMNAVDLQKEIAKYLSDSYEKLNDYKNGMKWFVLFSEHKDSLFNEEKTQDLTRSQLKYEFEKKEGEIKAEQDKKDALTAAELSRQKKTRNIFMGGFAFVLLFAGIFFYQRNNIRKEKHRSDELLLNILPSEIANELKQTGSAKAKSFTDVTVLFADFVNFTKMSERISAELLVAEIHACFSAFDKILQRYKIEKIKTIGDAYLCASGLPLPDPNHATNMIHAAVEIRDFMLSRKKEKEDKNETAFQLRIGIHTGPVVAGIVGIKKYAYDIWGDTVNIAARMEQNSEAGKINISNSTYELVKGEFSCIYRGKIEAKNKGEIDMFFVT